MTLAATLEIAPGVIARRIVYAELPVAPDVVGLDRAQVAAVGWAEPTFASDGNPRVAIGTWIIDDGDRRIAVDPFLNADDIIHAPDGAAAQYAAITRLFDDAGIPLDSVDTVVLSHIEGIGMLARRTSDGWASYFSSATIRVGHAALANHDSLDEAHWTGGVLDELRAAGLVAGYDDGERVSPHVTAELTGDHHPGHYVLHVGHPGQPAATFVGHLAVTPLHLATGPCRPQHTDPDRAWANLQRLAGDARTLVGSLWPHTGAGTWDGQSFTPSTRASA
jgi:hypothetical protein